MSSNRYRKKPVVIEAFQVTMTREPTNDAEGIPEWLREAMAKKWTAEGAVYWLGGQLFIQTLEGTLEVSLYDWIIRGVKGELYPYKTDIFEATYQEDIGEESPGPEAEDEPEDAPRVATPEEIREISDGYHTFNELYQHRHALFLALLKERGGWACRTHADGTTMYEGQFIAGMDLDGRQISYHLPDELWAIAEDLGLPVDEAPEWDGHSSDEVALRLLEYAMSKELED